MADSSYPDDLLYHAEHDWARIDGDQATLGITWYAQDSLGEIVFFDPPKQGTTVTKDSPYTEVESVKAVSEIYAPVAGEVQRFLAGHPKTRVVQVAGATHFLPMERPDVVRAEIHLLADHLRPHVASAKAA